MTRLTLATLALVLAPVLTPTLAAAQSGTWSVTNTDPAMVNAIITMQDRANGTAPGGANASVGQQGANNTVGVGQSGGGRQRAQVTQVGCNNSATSIQTAPNTINMVVQGGCNNSLTTVQNQANTATFTFQMGN